jgi:two-component system, OmpR family, sensor histidine kinase VicK
LSRAKETSDYCHDSKSPSFLVTNGMYLQMIKQLKAKGIRQRFITEITQENVRYSKELAKHVELRHLEGVKGNFGIVDGKEYGAAANIYDLQPPVEFIYSNVKTFVEQQQYFFETLWNKAIPAEQRIKEIEEGRVVHYQTRIIENPDEAIKEIGRLNTGSNKLDICLTSGGMQYSHDYFFDIKKRLLDKQRRGEHKGIRYVTNIDKSNLQISKLYLESGIQIRHVKNLPPMSFGVSDKEIAVTIEKMEGGKRVQSLLISNEPLYVRHFTSLFEEIWRNGIDAATQIRNIEEGHELANVDVLPNTEEAIRKAWTLVGSAKEEVLLMFSTPSAFKRQVKMGGLQVLLRAIQENHATVKILIPDDGSAAELVEQINKVLPQGSIRVMDSSLNTSITAVITDRKQLILFELKDDTKETSYEAVGLALHIDSRTLALSYASIFDNLWKQTELYEKLAVHDKMQKEFINIAAHELRTPIHPILEVAEAAKEGLIGYEEGWDLIFKHAKRLKRLTNDILDVSHIEAGQLFYRFEKVPVNRIIRNIVSQTSTNLNKDLQLELNLDREIEIEADKDRLAQVFANIIDNAKKFTKRGNIKVETRVFAERNIVEIKVTDTGIGIPSDVLPGIFGKFVTGGESGGTGLGLFISKAIVRSHGGEILANNNKEGGATFIIILPIRRKENQLKPGHD